MKIDNLRYQLCKRCIMDTTTEDIICDNEGVCNFCTDFNHLKEKERKNLENLILKNIHINIMKMFLLDFTKVISYLKNLVLINENYI